MTSGAQIRADQYLVQFETYEDYLNSLLNESHIFKFVQNPEAIRTIAQIGFRLLQWLKITFFKLYKQKKSN